MAVDPNETIGEVVSDPLTDEERYFHEQSYKEPVESLKRIEETAKFLVGATATTSGLFLAAFKLSMGDKAVSGVLWLMPYVWWAISIVWLICVFLPQKYATGRNEPQSWKEAFLEAQKRKFRRLMGGAIFFILGLLSAILPFSRF